MSALSEAIANDTGTGLPWAETEMTKVGDTVTGTVIGTDFKQAFNPETKQPAVWERSGEPIMEAIVKVSGTGKFRSDLEDGDNGDRAFHIRWAFENKAAFIEAMRAAGEDVIEPEIGGKFAAQLVSLKQNGGVRKPTKLFRYEYIPPPSGLAQAVAADAPAKDDVWGSTDPATLAAQVADKAAAAAQESLLAQRAPITPAAPVAPIAAQTDPVALLATIKSLIALGMTDAQITAVTGAGEQALTAIRALPPT